MKHVGLAVVVLALITSVVTQAQDADTQPSLDLKLSRTLTLDPSGTAPAPDTLERAPAIAAPPPVESDSVAWWGLVALLGLPLFYWMGRRQHQNLLNDSHQAEHVLGEQVTALQEAVVEAGAGPRNEWQSTLTSLRSQLEEKNRYIDRLHDQNASSVKQLGEFETRLEQQSEALSLQKSENTSALQQQAREFEQRLTEQTAQAEEKLEAQSDEARKRLEDQASESNQLLEKHLLAADEQQAAKAHSFQEALQEQASQAQQELDAVKQDSQQKITQLTELERSTSNERSNIKVELATIEAQLRELETYHATTLDELEKTSASLEVSEARLGPATNQVEELTAVVADLNASNDQRAAEIETLSQAKATLEEKLQPAAQQIESLSHEVATLTASNNDHAAEIETLSQAKAALEEKLQPAAQQIESLSQEVATLTASNNDRAAEIEALTEARAALEEKLETASQKVEALSSEKAALKESNDQRLSKIETLQEARTSLEHTLKQTTASLTQDLEETTSHLTRELEETRQENQLLLQQLDNEKRDGAAALASEQQNFKQSLEAEQREYEKKSEQTATALNARIGVLEAALEERNAKFKELEADFAFSSGSAQATLEDRDRDLAAMVAKLTSMAATENSLEELKQNNAALVNELDAKSARIGKLEEVLQESKDQIEQLESDSQRLRQNDSELAQMQSVIVETEQALSDARNELKQKNAQLEQNAKATGEYSKLQSAHSQELAQIRSQLAAVTQRAKEEGLRARTAIEERRALEQALQDADKQNSQEIARLQKINEELSTEFSHQNKLISSLETSVLQLETDLAFQENENTNTLKLLESATDQSADPDANIETNDLLGSHIQELESQLIKEQMENTASQQMLTETTSEQMELIEQQRAHSSELAVDVKNLKTSLTRQTEANEHLKKTLEQARKYREELEENTRDLERENRELSKSETRSRQELQTYNQRLDEHEKIVHEMKRQLDNRTSELKSTRSELDSVYAKVDKLTSAVAKAGADETGDLDMSPFKEQLEQTRAELSQRIREINEATSAREELERNAAALHDQLAHAQQEIAEKTEYTNTLGAQLDDLSEKRAHNLNVISLLEEQIDAAGHTPATKANRSAEPAAASNPELEEGMRARENIIKALEQELSQAEKTIAGLHQKLEDSQITERAETGSRQPISTPISEEDYEKLKIALLNKTRMVQSLSNEVEVNKDLIRVFESDSNMLHDTELKLESQEEHNQFLERELAMAVTENQTLKSEIEKAAKRIARQSNIGRTVSEDTRLAQLRSRLNTLETKNKEQRETISQLRGRQDTAS